MPYKNHEEQKAYQRQWCAARRNAFFSTRKCERCGSTDRLELHHRDPEKKTDHKIWSWSKKRRQAEIEKCEVLCYSCHKEETKAYLTEITKYQPRINGKFAARLPLAA